MCPKFESFPTDISFHPANKKVHLFSAHYYKHSYKNRRGVCVCVTGEGGGKTSVEIY